MHRVMSLRRGNARPSVRTEEAAQGTLCPNHAIVCPMIARQSSTAVEIYKDDARESLLVGTKDETLSTTTTTTAINVGCLIFA